MISTNICSRLSMMMYKYTYFDIRIEWMEILFTFELHISVACMHINENKMKQKSGLESAHIILCVFVSTYYLFSQHPYTLYDICMWIISSWRSLKYFFSHSSSSLLYYIIFCYLMWDTHSQKSSRRRKKISRLAVCGDNIATSTSHTLRLEM